LIFLGRLKTNTDYFDKNFLVIASNMNVFNAAGQDGRRGIYFLPKIQSKQFFSKPSLNYLYNNLAFQWFCLNLHSILSLFIDNELILISYINLYIILEFDQLETKALYCHFLDLKSKKIEAEKLGYTDALYFAASAYMIYAAEVFKFIEIL
jgi:hypothetical protein